MHNLFIFLALFAGLLNSAQGTAWKVLDSNRYQAEVEGWQFTVDASRGRLVSILPPGGENILLDGGHRVWLGPQAEWAFAWPPPVDWENGQATASLSKDSTELVLRLPHTDKNYPALERRYQLTKDGLLLIAGWRPNPTDIPCQCVQILQIRTDAAVHLSPQNSTEIPQGFGLLTLAIRPGIDLAATLPKDVVTIGKNDLQLKYDGREEKIGVLPQPILVQFSDGHRLRMHPATYVGATDKPNIPDHGLLTQTYLGATAWAMIEIEQLSPRLQARQTGDWAQSTVRLEILPTH